MAAVAVLAAAGCVTPTHVLELHRQRNPDGPYREEVCRSPEETGRGWGCDPDKVAQLRREARALNRAIAANLRRATCSGWTDIVCTERAAAAEFRIPADDFVRVLGCESGHNPRAVNASSGALGLGQHLPRYWPARAAALGYRYEDWSNPRANARVSAWLWATSGPQHWVCY